MTYVEESWETFDMFAAVDAPLEYSIYEGASFTVGEIRITGNEETQDRVIRRESLAAEGQNLLHQGAPLFVRQLVPHLGLDEPRLHHLCQGLACQAARRTIPHTRHLNALIGIGQLGQCAGVFDLDVLGVLRRGAQRHRDVVGDLVARDRDAGRVADRAAGEHPGPQRMCVGQHSLGHVGAEHRCSKLLGKATPLLQHTLEPDEDSVVTADSIRLAITTGQLDKVEVTLPYDGFETTAGSVLVSVRITSATFCECSPGVSTENASNGLSFFLGIVTLW